MESSVSKSTDLETGATPEKRLDFLSNEYACEPWEMLAGSNEGKQIQRLIREFRVSHRHVFHAWMGGLRVMFPSDKGYRVFGRVKTARRIWEVFFRKGYRCGTVPDIIGTTVGCRNLKESVYAAQKIQLLLHEHGDEVIYPHNGDDSTTLMRRVFTVKRQLRTYGIVFKRDGKHVEIAIQTTQQREWNGLVHDTPIYKPGLFQKHWDVKDTQVQVMRDYAFHLSEYLHYLQLLQLQEDGFVAPQRLRPVERPATPEWPGEHHSRAAALFSNLEAHMQKWEVRLLVNRPREERTPSARASNSRSDGRYLLPMVVPTTDT